MRSGDKTRMSLPDLNPFLLYCTHFLGRSVDTCKGMHAHVGGFIDFGEILDIFKDKKHQIQLQSIVMLQCSC